MLKAYFFPVIIGLHFFCIVLANLANFSRNYTLTHQGESRWATALLQESQTLLYRPFLAEFAKLSGGESPFGFFAPNIGSQYIVQYELVDSNGRLLATQSTPRIQEQEALHRYSNALHVFNDLHLKHRLSKMDSLNSRYAKAFAYSLAEQLGRQVPEVSKVRVKVMRYRFPKLRAYLRQRESRYDLLYQKTVHLIH